MPPPTEASARRIAGYAVEYETLRIGEHEITLGFPADVDAVLESGDDPYWAEVWASGLALAEYLLTGFDCQGQSWLELGCGVGLVGLIAARQGVHVLLTDYSETALDFARHNVHINGCDHARVVFLDWHQPALLMQEFDVILASDVIYDPMNWEPLLLLWERMLRPGCEILLAEPGRSNAPGFFELAANRGFTWDRTVQEIQHGERSYRIGIYRIQRTASP